MENWAIKFLNREEHVHLSTLQNLNLKFHIAKYKDLHCHAQNRARDDCCYLCSLDHRCVLEEDMEKREVGLSVKSLIIPDYFYFS